MLIVLKSLVKDGAVGVDFLDDKLSQAFDRVFNGAIHAFDGLVDFACVPAVPLKSGDLLDCGLVVGYACAKGVQIGLLILRDWEGFVTPRSLLDPLHLAESRGFVIRPPEHDVLEGMNAAAEFLRGVQHKIEPHKAALFDDLPLALDTTEADESGDCHAQSDNDNKP